MNQIPRHENQLSGRKVIHRPQVSEVFTERRSSGSPCFIVVSTTVTKGLVTHFEAGPYPQSGDIRLRKFTLRPNGSWSDEVFDKAQMTGASDEDLLCIVWGLPWETKGTGSAEVAVAASKRPEARVRKISGH